jgi:hypothetical protein
MSNLGYRASEIVGEAAARCASELRPLTAFDLFRSAQFWEGWIAIQLGGTQTAHKGEVDIEVQIARRPCRAEVKFSRAFRCKFNGIRGKDWSRNIMKWSITAKQDDRRRADALVLIGTDVDDLIYSWVVPFDAIPKGKRSLTITAPSARCSETGGRLDAWAVPPTEILPAFAAAAYGNSFGGGNV